MPDLFDDNTDDSYPKEIIPSQHFVEMQFVDDLDIFNYCHLIRRSSFDTYERTFDEFDEIQIDALFPLNVHSGKPDLKKCIGYSMNLLGGHFNVEHIKYRTLQKGSDLWDFRQQINLQEYIDCYEVLETKSIPVFFEFEALNEFQVSVITSNKDIVKNIYKDAEHNDQKTKALKELFDGKKHEIDCKVSIVHRPTVLNFWHVQLEVEYPIGVQSDNFSSVKSSKIVELGVVTDLNEMKELISEKNPKVQLICIISQSLLPMNCKSMLSNSESDFKIPEQLFKNGILE